MNVLLECHELNYLNVLSAATIVTGQIPKPGGLTGMIATLPGCEEDISSSGFKPGGLTGMIATLPGCEEDISSSGFKNLFIRIQESGEVSESNCKLIFYLYLTNLGLLECPELNYSNIDIIFILREARS